MPKDLISEEDFTKQTSRLIPKSPQRDSPGDTGSDADLEAEMGVNYEPEEPKKSKKDIPAFDKSH